MKINRTPWRIKVNCFCLFFIIIFFFRCLTSFPAVDLPPADLLPVPLCIASSQLPDWHALSARRVYTPFAMHNQPRAKLRLSRRFCATVLRRWELCPDALSECFWGASIANICLYITNDFTWAASVRNVAFPTVCSESSPHARQCSIECYLGKFCVLVGLIVKDVYSIMLQIDFMLKVTVSSFGYRASCLLWTLKEKQLLIALTSLKWWGFINVAYQKTSKLALRKKKKS